MNLADECGWALVRGAGVALASLLVAVPLRGLLAGSRGSVRALVWCLVLLPYLTPVILVGYGYTHFSLALVRHPALRELLYSLVLSLKLAPVAALILYFAPSALTAEALFCAKLYSRARPGALKGVPPVSILTKGPALGYCTAFLLACLLAFGEFEMASLFAVPSWTVALFDAQAGGLSLASSLRLGLPALLICAALVGLALFPFSRSRILAGPPARAHFASTGLPRRLGWTLLALSIALVFAVPAFLVLRGAAEGFARPGQSLVLLKNISAGILFGVGGAILAYTFAGLIVGAVTRGRAARLPLIVGFASCVPGLLGTLLLSLCVLALFQLPGLSVLYDTPLPLIVALGLFLLPPAVLLRALLCGARKTPALHQAGILRRSAAAGLRKKGREILWEMKARPSAWAGFLLFFLGYADLTASSILAPSAMTPVFVMLYNLMHYGQSAVLSVLVFASFAVIPALMLLLAGARGIIMRVVAHG